MITYKQFRPTGFDAPGLDLPDLQEWLVAPCTRNRDSAPWEESNFAACLARLGGESDDVEVHMFGHWACGWLEIILIKPGSHAASLCDIVESDLEGYALLDEDDCSEREEEAAQETWRVCYSAAERIAYIRRYRSQFDFRDFADMLGCVRGKYFAGYASELIAR